MNLLVTGPTGQIGGELSRELERLGTVISADRSMLDLTDPDSIVGCLREIRPDVILNAAGYTAVDQAESEESLATMINGRAPGILAEEAARLGAAFIHYSTDYVFDGAKDGAYLPTDDPNPINTYGRTKLAGERAVLAAGGAPLILRVSWIYGLRRHNFLLTILRRAAEQDTLRIVDDQFGCPTWCRTVAQATTKILANHMTRTGSGASFDGHEGVHHLCCAGRATWREFAQRIIELAELDDPPLIEPISTDDYPTAAQRPRNSVLDCSLTKEAFGVRLPTWDEALTTLFEENVSAAMGRGGTP